MTRKGAHHNAKMRGWRLNGGVWPDDREPRTAPLPRVKKPGPEEVAFKRMVEWITTDLEGFLPNEISDLGVVSLDAWGDVAPESSSAALVSLDGKEWDTFDGDAFFEAQQSQLKAAVIQALQRKGVAVVPKRTDALRLLAAQGKLNEDHLSAFEDVILRQDVTGNEAAEAFGEGHEPYTIRPDGGVVRGILAEGRYFTVKGEGKPDFYGAGGRKA
jgi:hypothetical protein